MKEDKNIELHDVNTAKTVLLSEHYLKRTKTVLRVGIM